MNMTLINKIPIIEHFKAIQGEGKEAGFPTYFIRVGGCNMVPKCEFCDSSYSWKEKGILKTQKDLEKIISQAQVQHITFTGGEPTLYDDFIEQLIRKFPDYKFSVESNGLILSNASYDTITISPKQQNFNQEVLTAYGKLHNSTFKFVYEDKNDLWWEELVKVCNIDKDKVYIMPEGADRETQIKRMPEVLEYCQSAGFKFSPRLHVIAYDRRRGV